MANPVTGLNPRVLRWARKRAGLSTADVGRTLNKTADVIDGWEAGIGAPTYAQLERLAYQLFKRPLALFFFPEPPDERDPTQEFRTLPEIEIRGLHRDTRYALRQAEAMQLALKELNDGINPSRDPIFRKMEAQADAPPRELAESVRSHLGVTLDVQTAWKDSEEALKHWRDIVQDNGIFVFKRSFKQRDVSGFCLMDAEFPIIFLNNTTAHSRQTFTLFHELAHILLHTSGVTKQDDRYIDELEGAARRIEIFANMFTAELLVPSADFEQHLPPDPYDDENVRELAHRYHVSREAILRRLLDRGLVEPAYYESKAAQWAAEFGEGRGEGGGNYYATQASYLGTKYLQLAFSRYYQGRFGIEQLADYLNVKVRNVAGLEQFVLKQAA